ncbi:MAG: SIS domain-containing protein, partial [Bacteroidia bacterium]
MDHINLIQQKLQSSIDLKTQLINDKLLLEKVSSVANKIIECYKNKGKVLFCGNGGSAADSQHLAAELSGRFYYDRP